MPEGITNKQPGDQYYRTISDRENDGPNLSENSSSGVFFVTGVPDRGRVTFCPSVEI